MQDNSNQIKETAMAENKTERKIKINDVDYNFSDLSDNAKGQLQGLQIAEAEMKRLNMQLAIAQTARNAYMQALSADLPAQQD